MGIRMTFELVYPKDIAAICADMDTTIIDLRARRDFERGHIDGAVNYEEEQRSGLMSVLSDQKNYVLYCEHGGNSMQLARKLGQRGYRVATLVGGYRGYQSYLRSLRESM